MGEMDAFLLFSPPLSSPLVVVKLASCGRSFVLSFSSPFFILGRFSLGGEEKEKRKKKGFMNNFLYWKKLAEKKLRAKRYLLKHPPPISV